MELQEEIIPLIRMPPEQIVPNIDQPQQLYLSSLFEQLQLSQSPDTQSSKSNLNCLICLQPTNSSPTLPCNCPFCPHCIKLLIQDLIGCGKVLQSELKCPQCSSLFSDQVALPFIGQQSHQKLLLLRQKLIVDQLVASQLAKYCPVPDCRGYVHVKDGKVSICCVQCRVTICTTCFKAAHPGMSCEEYAKELGENNCELDQLLMSRNWKRCPFCACLIEKPQDDDGCNHLRCHSPICKGSPLRCICYLCGKGLNEKHHFSHFKTTGPFGDRCNTIDGIEDEPLEVEDESNNPDVINPQEWEGGWDDEW